MSYRDVRNCWKLDIWFDRIRLIEEQVVANLDGKKVGHDIENILFRNYARMSLCLRKMLTLLDNGYPDGALSIARTVYEINVLTDFLYLGKERNGQELLERYFEDQNVKAYKNMLALHEGIEQMPNASPVWLTKAEELRSSIKQIRVKYEDIRKDYWWANIVFNGKTPTFYDIEKYVGTDVFVRALYKRACISIHASSMGSFALLGRSNPEGNIIYTSPTDQGFEVPLLLGMVSHEKIADIVCSHWHINKKEILSDMESTYKEYFENIFLQKCNSVLFV